MKYFDQLFCYDYTKHMEDSLDLIAKGEKVWHELCKECYEQINSLSEGLGQQLDCENSNKKISIKIYINLFKYMYFITLFSRS